MGRLALSALISFGIVVGLFLLMNSLIGTGEGASERENTVIDLGFIEEEKEVQRKERRVPKKPPPPKEPPPPQQQAQEKNKVITAIVNIEIENLDATFEGEGLYSGALGAAQADFAGFGDGDAIPLATFPATYPQEAAVKGIEGWVEFSFTIEPDGSPSNIKVLNAKPRRVFEKEARRAIRRWKFKPKQYNGQPVAQTNMRYKLVFELNKN
ncbi:energy transducer TonB [Kangiella sp. HZ709]|uniref:energy transducer TonB n=1 Tax=Kangiella sp. HZ709 TaxID=2666328 RepID=UPI0012B0B687|nr:energy transducer TonB [Kangiella sp. HZ709]MRX28477.1 TonB family protein [Kangiella sp. HZ709]